MDFIYRYLGFSMAIALTITNTGLSAVLDAQNKGLTLRLNKIKFGSGKYEAQASMTKLRSPFAEATIASGGVEPDTSILRLISNFKDTKSRDIYEMGLYDEQGNLFALASSQTEPFFKSSPNFSVIVVLGIRLLGVPAERVELVLDPETSKAIALIGMHISENNPHPQYALLSNMNTLLQRVEKRIGEVFLTNMPFENGEQVARFLGYGRWKRYGDGEAIITFRHGETVKNYEWLSKMGASGGAYQHKLTVNEMPEHKHDVLLGDAITSGESKVISAGGGIGLRDFYDEHSLKSAGNSQSHNNVQPSIVTGAWVRIPDESSLLSLSANRQQVSVGQTVEFILRTSLAEFTMIDYEIQGVTSNQISLASLAGAMMVGADGSARLRLTASDDYLAQGNKNLKVQLTDSRLSATVTLIDSGETQAPTKIYKAGTHEIVIQPNQSVTFDMFAGGGGGGGSRWSTQHGDFGGKDGGNVVLTIAESSITVGGGRGGTEGAWANGSAFHNGQAGAGGSNNIDNQNSLEIMINQRGVDGVPNQNRNNVQRGADVVAGAMSGSNFGGDGALGVGDGNRSYGGAGGSGGHVKAKFVNTTDNAITATLVIGATGVGGKSGRDNIYGKDGGFAYAVVS